MTILIMNLNDTEKINKQGIEGFIKKSSKIKVNYHSLSVYGFVQNTSICLKLGEHPQKALSLVISVNTVFERGYIHRYCFCRLLRASLAPRLSSHIHRHVVCSSTPSARHIPSVPRKTFCNKVYN